MRVVVLTALLSTLLPPPLAAQTGAARGGAPAATDSQSIRIGRATVARPFGAELVDRLVLVGSYQVGGRRVRLIRGDATGACPSRFVLATEQRGAAPTVSTPFGTCDGNARARLSGGMLDVALRSPADGTLVHFLFDGSVVRQVDGGRDAESDQCVPASHVDTVTQAAVVTEFERDYPEEFRKRGTLGKAVIDPGEMRSLVTTLACLAPWPAAERRVPAIATPLFASRHGPAAFATLAALAEDPASGPHLRAAARSFAAEMIYRVERREAL